MHLETHTMRLYKRNNNVICNHLEFIVLGMVCTPSLFLCKKTRLFFLPHPKKAYFCSLNREIGPIPFGAQWCNGSTTDSGSVSLGSSPGWATKKKAERFRSAFGFQFIPKCIRILEARISTTTGLEPRGKMMSALRLVGSMNCWCMGLTKVW